MKNFKKAIPILILIAIVVDLFYVGYKINTTYDKEYYKKDALVEFFEKDKSIYRVLFMPPLGKTNYYARFGIESVTGYHAAKLKIYDDFLKKETNLKHISMLNVKFIVSPFKMELPLATRVNGDAANWFIYRNPHVFNRYFFKDNAELKVLSRDTENVKLMVTSETNQTIIFSEIWYPSWKIYIDHREVENKKFMDLLCSADLPAGISLVELKYEVSSFKYGMFIAFISCSIIVFVLLFRRK